MTGGEEDKANQHWQNHAAMEVNKSVGSQGKRRQLVLKILMPISSDSDVASREEDSISWRYNRPAVQAMTPVSGGCGGRSVKT
ncbi:Os12g0499758 [Oryza sativa Japonica Group]|uniref:Os12g0499758 protein n=1 Tax=Oryza sativa subsp. japonica TaxID=39947 RepID=A0A0P0YAF7_ORYSJ|nr:Os12g0499758 [Oryza sativa Japonica Group]